ncbi:hypothetical protein [Alistipes putredinis]|uniref:hypothetical protein n=1 Tax=Alistipes putredinis TaxID=28117 RepID=UPI003AB342C5
MKNTENQEATFQMVVRPIPTTNSYSIMLGEIVDGQFVPTDRRPANVTYVWACVKENPLAPDQKYVSGDDLCEVVGSLALEWNSCMLFSNLLVFTVKDYPNEKSSEEEE